VTWRDVKKADAVHLRFCFFSKILVDSAVWTGDEQMSRQFASRYFLNSIPIGALAVSLVALAFASGMSLAQEEGKDSVRNQHLGICFSSGISSYREDLIVPLSFDGPGLSLGGVYTRRTDRNLVQFRLRVGLGYLKNRYSHEAWVLMLEMRPSWVRKLAEHDRYGEFWGGISIPLQMNNLFLESWDDSHLYWLTAHSLAAAFQWEKKVSRKDHAVVRMEVPFLSLVSRPPAYRYNKQDPLTHWTFHFSEPNRSLHVETPSKYRALFIQMLLRHQVRQSLLNLGLEFHYAYCRKPEKMWGLNTSVLVSYQWRIGS
jgi:hypothetical protein